MSGASLNMLSLRRCSVVVMWQVRIALVIAVPNIATAITFIVYTLASGNVLQPADAFAALAIFSVLRFPILHLSDVVSFVVQLMVAMERLNAYLCIFDEYSRIGTIEYTKGEKKSSSSLSSSSSQRSIVQSTNDSDKSKVEKVGDNCIQMTDFKNQKEIGTLGGFGVLAMAPQGQFYWDESLRSDSFVFKVGKRKIEVDEGKLLVIMGAVGSGKSTLMQGILRETYNNVDGDTARQCVNDIHRDFGRVAYVSQQPWM